jgi:chemotaxis protein histidine kinase CheA
MTIGKNSEAPAAYALTSTIRRLLDHLTEVQLYSAKDLAHVAHTIENLSEIVSTSHGKHSPYLVTLLVNRLDVCRELCSNLQQKLERLDPGLTEIHEKLISILRSMSAANTKAKVQEYYPFKSPRSITKNVQFSTSEVKRLQDQLKEIDAQRVDGHFVNASGQTLAGDGEVSELLRRILMWAEIILERCVEPIILKHLVLVSS